MQNFFNTTHIILPCAFWETLLSRIRFSYKHKIIYLFLQKLMMIHKHTHTKIIFQISYFYVFYVQHTPASWMQFKIQWEEMKFYTCNFYLINNRVTCVTYHSVLLCESLIKFPRQSSFLFPVILYFWVFCFLCNTIRMSNA